MNCESLDGLIRSPILAERAVAAAAELVDYDGSLPAVPSTIRYFEEQSPWLIGETRARLRVLDAVSK